MGVRVRAQLPHPALDAILSKKCAGIEAKSLSGLLSHGMTGIGELEERSSSEYVGDRSGVRSFFLCGDVRV